MKVGINLLNFGPAVGPESLARWARFAEALGYHFAMISDHVAVTGDVHGRYPAPFYDPFTTLAWLAGITRKIELGTTVVILPYRHPLQTAKMATMVDRLSGGRLIFGVGVGWAREEFDALGVPFHRRGAMSDDYLAAIREFWTGDVVSHDGPFVSFREVHTGPRPVRHPHPPIWVGGSSDAALRRAVRLGDGWHPIRFKLGWLTETGLPRLRDIAAKEGRPIPSLCPRIRLRLTERPVAGADRGTGEGTLEQIHGDLRALESLGASHVLLDTYADIPEETREHEPAFRLLATVAERAVDLARETVR